MITHLDDGFDFLGINFRSYRAKKGIKVKTKLVSILYFGILLYTKNGIKFKTKPSKSSVNSFKDKVRDLYYTVIHTGDFKSFIISLNNLIRGTAMYWRMTSAREVFRNIDYFIIHKNKRLLRKLYPSKSHKWIKDKHYKPSSNKDCKDKYLLTDPETGQQIIRMNWFRVKYDNYSLRYGVSPYNKDDWDYIEKIKFKPIVKCLYV